MNWLLSMVIAVGLVSNAASTNATAGIGDTGCSGCATDEYGDYCLSGPQAPFRSCEDGDMAIYRNGVLVAMWTTCEGSGTCGQNASLNGLDGAGRRVGSDGSLVRSIMNGRDKILIDCAGVIVDRSLSAETARRYRAALVTLTL